MKNRTDINLITLDEGQLAKNKGEAVLEKRYASENGYKVGDKITVTGKTMVITGIGSVTDYDLPIKNRTDVVADSKKFGLMFVSDDEYDELKSRGKQVESYSYAYRLNGAMTYEQLKEKLQNIPFDYKQVNDVFYKESLADTVGKKMNSLMVLAR